MTTPEAVSAPDLPAWARACREATSAMKHGRAPFEAGRVKHLDALASWLESQPAELSKAQTIITEQAEEIAEHEQANRDLEAECDRWHGLLGEALKQRDRSETDRLAAEAERDALKAQLDAVISGAEAVVGIGQKAFCEIEAERDQIEATAINEVQARYAAKAERDRLAARVAVLEAALREIAKQKLGQEMLPTDYVQADFEDGYIGCVMRARAALQPEPGNAVRALSSPSGETEGGTHG